MAEYKVVLKSSDNSIKVLRTQNMIKVVRQGGGGGGAVASVNGKVGTVVLTAEDVGASSLSHSHLAGDVTGLSAVATTGSYNSLSDKPTIPTTKADIGLGNVDNTSDANKPVSTATATALAGKANTAHSHAIADITSLQASLNGKADTTYVDAQVASIVNSAPETLNTLNELAQALGDDPNFATTVSTQIGQKADTATTVQKSGEQLGNFDINVNIANGENQIVSDRQLAFVSPNNYVFKAPDSSVDYVTINAEGINGNGTSSIQGILDPANAQDATTKNYVDTADQALQTAIDGKADSSHAHQSLTDGVTTVEMNNGNIGAGFMLVKGNMTEAGFVAEGGFSLYARGGADGLTGNWDNYLTLHESGGMSVNLASDTAGEARMSIVAPDGIRYMNGVTGGFQLKADNNTASSGIRNISTPDADGTLALESYVDTGLAGKANTAHTHAVDELSDVTVTTPADGDVLTYDNATSTWVNAVPTGGGGGGITAQDVRAENYNYATGNDPATTAPKLNEVLLYSTEADAIANAQYRTRPFIFNAGEIPSSIGANNTANNMNWLTYAKVKTADGTVVNANPDIGDRLIVRRNATYANRFSGIDINGSKYDYKLSEYSTSTDTSWWLQSGNAYQLLLEFSKSTNANNAWVERGQRLLSTNELTTPSTTPGILDGSRLYYGISQWANYTSGTTYLMISGKRIRRGTSVTTLTTGNLTITSNTNVSNDYHIVQAASAVAPRTASITSLTAGQAFSASDEVNFIFENLNTTHAMTLVWNAMWKTPSGITLPTSIPAGATVFIDFYYLSATTGWIAKSITGTGY